MNLSFSTLLPKCQMFQHTYTRFFWNQELNLSRVRENSWLAGGYAPLWTTRYHTHDADCTGLGLNEMHELLQGRQIFCILLLEETDIFSTVYPLHYLLHTTLEHQTGTVHPIPMCLLARTCAREPVPRLLLSMCTEQNSAPRCSWAKTSTLKLSPAHGL